ncbi:hypothetical protein [Leptothoe sp. PORK10 BA2]|uniref:hypothetical protein n=1 Tax=Leptothoe sp. PORK10 BA2 TaxID=3110254 RepID=UPI002B1FB47F|nr:hypothetical protein [Leptothoe sp. PORK10 BA2]MEA5466096.1 hypothetical protein [Leptothoe sp. PORK10 BA2]
MKNIVMFGALIVTMFLQFSYLKSLKDDTSQLSNSRLTQQELSRTLNLNALKLLPAFGFENILADWIFLNFIQYFGEADTRKITGYSASPLFFDVLIDRDPRFVGSYLYLVNSVSMYAGQPQESIRLMEKGLATMLPTAPDRSYFVWRYKATDEMLFIGDNKAAQESFRTAANWAEQSSDEDAQLTAKLSRQTAAFLETNPNSTPALISGWMNVLSRAIDDNIRQEAIAQIEKLGGEVLLAQDGQVTVRYGRNRCSSAISKGAEVLSVGGCRASSRK